MRTVTGSNSDLTLLIHDVVLASGHDSSTLNALDTLGKKLTRENGVRRESLPVTTSCGRATQWTSNWLFVVSAMCSTVIWISHDTYAKQNIDSFATMLFGHCFTTIVGELAIPRGTYIDTSWEDRVVV